MECRRCKGKMSFEQFQDFWDDTGKIDFKGWRCLNCGEIFDPIIYLNRKTHPLPKISKRHKKVIGVVGNLTGST